MPDWLLIAAAGAFLLGLAYVVGWLLPLRILRPPRRPVHLTPADLGFDYEDIELTTTDGWRLAAWFVPAAQARTTLIILHGNGSCREPYLEFLPELVPYGIEVLLYDGRAHGESEGDHCTFGYHEWRDVEAATHWLDTNRPGQSLGLFGHSMGGAIAVRAGTQVRGLSYIIVESCFSDLHEIIHAYGQRDTGLWLPRFVTDTILSRAGQLGHFPPREVAPERLAQELHVPTLVIHGTADERVAFENGERIFAAVAAGDKAFYPVAGAGHDELAGPGGAGYWERVRCFVLGRS